MKINIETSKLILRFLTPREIKLLVVGVLAGVGLFFLEIFFAYGIQALATSLGLIGADAAGLPGWIPVLSFRIVVVFLVALGVVRGLLQWLSVWLQGAVFDEFRHIQRERLVRWTFRSQSSSSSEIMHIFNDQIGAAASAVMQLLTICLYLTQGVLVAASLFAISWRATFMGIGLMGIIIIPFRRVDSKIRDAGAGCANESNRITGQLVRGIKNLILIQIYGTQGKEEEQSLRTLKAFRDHMLSFHFLSGLKYGVPQIVGVVLVCVAAIGIQYGQIIPKTASLVYFYLFLRLVQSISSVSMATSSFAGYLPQFKALFNWWVQNNPGLNAPTKVDHYSTTQFTSPVGWNIQDIEYSYPNAKTPTLSKLTFDAKPGECFAIVGSSGVGKSTLLNLMLGNLLPSSGKIQVCAEGQQYSIFDIKDRLNTSIGYVGSEPFLVEGTVYDNLIYGMQNRVTTEQINEALALAEATFFVDQLTDGLNHRISEQGHGLSAGQKQRLSLARALLRNPKALVLDEATANLDAQTEARLIDTFKKMKGSITIIAVTHREALVSLADRVLKLGSENEVLLR